VSEEAKKGMDKETRELVEIGEEINQVFAYVNLSLGHRRLTAQKLDRFESYLWRTETLHPMIAPMEAKKTFKMIDIAKKRISIVRAIIKQLESEEKCELLRDQKGDDL
jgi:hypothetical protein